MHAEDISGRRRREGGNDKADVHSKMFILRYLGDGYAGTLCAIFVTLSLKIFLSRKFKNSIYFQK
jgi:hypothetical protein